LHPPAARTRYPYSDVLVLVSWTQIGRTPVARHAAAEFAGPIIGHPMSEGVDIAL
jgi:hypothetical protein